MRAVSKSLAPFYKATSMFITTILPESLKVLILAFFVIWASYLRHRSKRQYNAMIDEKSSRFVYRRRTRKLESKELIQCSICLSEFSDGEVGRELPCNHVFHKNCLDTWLKGGSRPTCPLCRRSVLPEEIVWEQRIVQSEQLMGSCFEKELALMLLATVNSRSCHLLN